MSIWGLEEIEGMDLGKYKMATIYHTKDDVDLILTRMERLLLQSRPHRKK